MYASRNKNMTSRFNNRLTAYTYDVLEPLYNLDTGAEIEAIHSRADLEGSHSISCTSRVSQFLLWIYNFIPITVI